ncbi:MAG: hypothetical protein K2N22_04510, partial [Clostridia bacterium]|nr:hypothetical protein [Clostridia bacterium]
TDMSCPYFEIQKSDDFENIAEIILADNEPKHFVRQRRYSPFDVSDGSIRSAFDKKIRHSQSGYFSGLRLFSIIFPIMTAISIYVMVAAAPENRLGLIAIPITTLGLGIIWAIFLVCHSVEFAFIKSCDHLFIADDAEGNHYSVEVRKKRIRVLYKGVLYVIKGKKIKTVRNDRKIYLAYLTMYPQSVLDMGKFVDNSDRDSEPVLTPHVEYLPDGSCSLSFGERGHAVRQNSPASFGHTGVAYSYHPLLRHLQFAKYIFTVNGDLKLTSVYTAARENAVINYDALTLAEVTESGNAAIEALKEIAAANVLLAKILNDIE